LLEIAVVIQLAVTFLALCIAPSLPLFLHLSLFPSVSFFSPAHRLPVCSGLNGMQMEWVFGRPFIRP